MVETNKKWLQYVAALSSSILAVSTGLHFGWTSPAIPKLLDKDYTFQVSKEEISYIVMIGPIGYFVSAVLNVYVIDQMGRKGTLLFLSLPQIVAWILIANAPNVIVIYVSRIVERAAEGSVFSVLPMYICEISEPEIRGILGSFFTLGLLFGILLINIYGSYVSIKIGAYISISVPLLFIVTFLWMPESPYYLLMKKRVDDARESLRRLLQKTDVEEELALLTSVVQQQLTEHGSYLDILKWQASGKPFTVLLVLRLLQQFSGYYAFSFYTQFIFEHSGSSFDPITNSILYSLSHLIFTTLGTLLIDKLGRKFLLLTSIIGISLVLFGEGTYFWLYETKAHSLISKKFNGAPLTGLLLYSFFFNLGLGIVPNLLTGEMFSVRMKAKALSVLIALCAPGVSISTKLFDWLNDSAGMHVPFYTFASISTLGIFFCYYCVPETKGKTLEDIRQDLSSQPSQLE